MNRKALAWLTAAALGLTSASSLGAGVGWAKTSADFTDLAELDAATKAKFDAMISAGIFDGVSDTSFGLQEEMNRAQFAKVSALILGLDVNKDLQTSSFADVSADDAANGYALPYIEALKKAGIAEGYGDGVYNPAGKVTKEQLATFLVRIVGKDADAQTLTGNDRTVSDWAQGYVAEALQLKLLSGGADGKFGGNANATRDLLLTGAYEAKQQYVPPSVSSADFGKGNTLKVTLTSEIDPTSVDLAKIVVNGVPLDPTKDTFTLSDDKKSIVIALHDGYELDTSKTPVVEASGLKTTQGIGVKTEAAAPVPVTVTEAPVKSTPAAADTPPPSTPPAAPTPVVTIDDTSTEPGVSSYSVRVQGSVAGELYYVALASSEEAPSVSAIKSQDRHVTATAGSYAQLSLAGLTPNTAYTLYVYELSSLGKNSAVKSIPFQTLPGEQANPSLELNGAAAEQGAQSLSIPVSVTAIDKLYYVVQSGAAPYPTPTAEEIKDPVANDVAHIVYGSLTPTQPSGIETLAFDGLYPGMDYTLFVTGESGETLTDVQSYAFQTIDVPFLTVNVRGTGRETTGATDTISISVAGDHAETVHYVLAEYSDYNPSTPSVAQVLNHQDGNGNEAYKYGELTKNGDSFAGSIAGVDPSKSYQLFTVGTNEAGDGEVTAATFYRTDATLSGFTSLGEPTYDFMGITATPDYTGNALYAYYLTSDGELAEAPSADAIISLNQQGTYSVGGTISITDPMHTTDFYLYVVIVGYDGTEHAYLRSDVVSAAVTEGEGAGGGGGGGGFPGPYPPYPGPG